MNCAFCNQVIDDDSYFCDQCGRQILICPTCGAPGSKKRCMQDGSALVPAQDLPTGGASPGGAGSAVPAGTAAGPSPAGARTGDTLAGGSPVGAGAFGDGGFAGAPRPAAPVGANGAAAGPATTPLKLMNGNLGLQLDIAPQTIIGRKVGEFASVFSQHSSVSSRHAQFTVDATGTWYVTDLGSTNGTFYGDNRLVPNQPTPLRDGTFLTIANIEFFVEITAPQDDDAEGGTMRL